MQCHRHPKVETFLACGKCERAICPNCAISGPVGMRCRDCASLKSTTLYQVNPGRLAAALIAGLVVCSIGAQILEFGGFFVLIIGSIYGGFVSEVILRIVGRKRGRSVEAVGIISIIGGALIVFGYHAIALYIESQQAAAHSPLPSADIAFSFGALLFSNIWQIIGTAIAASVCYARLRE